MKQKLIQTSIFFVLSLSFFAGIYFAPWQFWLGDLIWIKLGIGFVIFLLPGMCLYKILDRENSEVTTQIVPGFAASILLITIIGLFARFANLSFKFIEVSFLLIGAIGLSINLFNRQKARGQVKNANLKLLLDLSPIFFVTVLMALAVTNRILSEDDQIYIAYQFHFLKAFHIDFKEIIFGYDQLSPSRFWLTSIPLVQAFFSSITKTPGIVLAAGYYEPFLAIFSVLSFHQFAKSLGLSAKAATLVVVLQFTFLVLLSEYMHSGAPFLHQLSTDKAIAAFIITPIFFERTQRLLDKSNWNKISTALIVTLCLSVTHPVIFAYAGFVAGLTTLFRSTRRTFYRDLLPISLIILLGLLPQMAIRMMNHPSNKIYNLSTVLQSDGIEDMIQFWKSSNFYGFNPSILTINLPYVTGSGNRNLDNFIHYGWLTIPILAAIFSIKKAPSQSIASYVLASSILLTLAYIPFTGWIIGYFFTPWMLERTTWIYPYGIGTVFLLVTIKESLYQHFHQSHKRIIQKYKDLIFWGISLICISTMYLYMKEKALPDFERFENRVQRYEELSRIGEKLDNSNKVEFRIIGVDDVNDYIPMFSIKGKLISYRPSDPTYSYFIPIEEHRQRMLDRQAIFSNLITSNEKLQILQKYQVKYLILKKSDLDGIQDLLSSYPDIFSREVQTRNYIVIATKLTH